MKSNIQVFCSRNLFCVSLLFLLILSPQIVLSATHYDQSEMATYSVPDSVSGDTFYVDVNNGDDTYDGLSATYTGGTNGPFKTLKRAFYKYRSNYVVGGDVVKIKSGIYREAVIIESRSEQLASLSASTPIVIGPYGDGEVVIDPSSTPLSWTAHDANIYWADWTGPYAPWAVVLNDDFTVCRDKQLLAELTAYGLWWYDSANSKIYINTGGVDPGTLDPVITYNYTSAEQYALKTNGMPYVKLYGLTLRGAARYGFTDYSGGNTSTGIVVEKCTIKHNNSTGIRIFGDHSFLTKNHIYGNMLYNWPRGRTYAANGGWGQGGTISNHGTASGNIVHENGGEGLGIYGGSGYTVFEDNIVYDNWSVGLYLDNAPHCTFRRNLVYANNPDTANAVEEWQLPQWVVNGGQATIGATMEKIKGRMRQEGIMVGDETATNATAQSIDHKIYNNILIGNRRGFLTYGQATGAGLKNFTIANNTIILPSTGSAYGEYAGIVIDSNNSNNAGTVIKNNIIYSTTMEPLIHADAGDFVGVELDNNVYYATVSSTPFRVGSYPGETDYSFSLWKSNTAKDAVSKFLDPLFVGPVGSFDPLKYYPGAGSPIKDFAMILSGFHDDFYAHDRGAKWDVGALERGALIEPPSVD